MKILLDIMDTLPLYAYYFYFLSGERDWDYDDRFYGQSVRAVTE